MWTNQFKTFGLINFNEHLDWQNDGQSWRNFGRYWSQENHSGLWKESSQKSGTNKIFCTNLLRKKIPPRSCIHYKDTIQNRDRFPALWAELHIIVRAPSIILLYYSGDQNQVPRKSRKVYGIWNGTTRCTPGINLSIYGGKGDGWGGYRYFSHLRASLY